VSAVPHENSPPAHRPLVRIERGLLRDEVGADETQVVLRVGLLVVLYVGRLTVLDPEANVIKATALISGLIVNPAFFLLFARSLLQSTPTAARAPA
jgi:hypothetical protein